MTPMGTVELEYQQHKAVNCEAQIEDEAVEEKRTRDEVEKRFVALRDDAQGIYPTQGMSPPTIYTLHYCITCH